MEKIVMLIAFYCLCSCISQQKSASHALFENNCVTDSSLKYGFAFHLTELNESEHKQSDSLLRGRFSEKTIRIVNATGLTNSLLQLISYEKHLNKNQQSINEYLLFRQNITDHIQLVNFDIASAAAEVNCEIQRSLQAKDVLIEKENKNVKKATILSIVVGSTAVIIAGSMHLHNKENSATFVEISGGTMSAALGLSTFFIKPPRMLFLHKRNMIKGIWYNKDLSDYFPPAVEYYLNHAVNNQPTAIEQLKENWQSYKMNKELYFGEGGKYTAEELSVRARMLAQIENQIKLMNNDLTVFLNELVINQPEY